LRIVGVLLAISLSTGIAAAAGNPFVGTWKLDPTRSRFPDEFKIQSKGGNTYAIDFGVGSIETIVADGSFQKGYAGTLLSVRAAAPGTWVVARKQGSQTLLNATWKLSKDNRTLTDYFRGYGPGGVPYNVDYVYRRTATGSGFAADWRSVKETMNSPFVVRISNLQTDGLTIVIPFESTKNVKFDGRYYPNQGATRGLSSSIARRNERTLAITTKYKGKVTATEQLGLSIDQKTLTLTQRFPGHVRPNVLVFDRVPGSSSRK
jgi:hypothetical protein